MDLLKKITKEFSETMELIKLIPEWEGNNQLQFLDLKLTNNGNKMDWEHSPNIYKSGACLNCASDQLRNIMKNMAVNMIK